MKIAARRQRIDQLNLSEHRGQTLLRRHQRGLLVRCEAIRVLRGVNQKLL